VRDGCRHHLALAVTAFGLTSLLSAVGEGFELIRRAGVARPTRRDAMARAADKRQAEPAPGLRRAA